MCVTSHKSTGTPTVNLPSYNLNARAAIRARLCGLKFVP
uniref:Uncharacterized protein n=1 Tax=Anguilla anguilla TaxID=7936 RepID=A0A0E9XVJ3_ANGAN